MTETVLQSVETLVEDCKRLAGAVNDRNWRSSEQYAKVALSQLSKITTRLRGLVDAMVEIEGQQQLM